MGRTSRTALAALVAATVLGGCSGGGDATAVPSEVEEEIAAAATETVDFCTAAQQNVDAGSALTEFSNAGPPPRPADELSDVLEPVRESNEQMVATAPEVMRADIAQVAEVTEMRLAAFESSGGDAAAVDADPAITEKLTAAAEPSARIRQYLRAVCRVDPG